MIEAVSNYQPLASLQGYSKSEIKTLHFNFNKGSMMVTAGKPENIQTTTEPSKQRSAPE